MGSVASIIPERAQVHHSIRNSLDSHDTVEVLAAVYAASKFAAHSRFASLTKMWTFLRKNFISEHLP
jgi:integrator complex subunit 7